MWPGTLGGEKVAVKAIRITDGRGRVKSVSVVTHSSFPISGRPPLAIVQGGNYMETFETQKHRTPLRSFLQFEIFCRRDGEPFPCFSVDGEWHDL